MRTTFIVTFLALCFSYGVLAQHKKTKSKRGLEHIPSYAIHTSKIIQDVYRLWNLYLREPNLDLPTALLRNKEQEMIKQFLMINSKLTTLEERINGLHDTNIVSILEAFPTILELKLDLHELSLTLGEINFAESQLRDYLIFGYRNLSSEERPTTTSKPSNSLGIEINEVDPVKEMSNRIIKREADPNWLLEEFTLENFATWATGHSPNSVPILLRKLTDLVVSRGTQTGLFQLINQVSEEMKTYVCNLRQSPHQVLYNLYNTIALAELKGNTILQFSYMLLKMYNKGNFTVEAQLARSNYDKMSKKKLEEAQKALQESDKSIYRCDPKQHVEGVTYTKITKLLQGYIENEVNLNPYGTCRENCQYYEYTEYNGCYKAQFCAKQPQCRGKVVECRYVDSDMHICTSSNPERRYEWIEYENGRVLGSKGVCEKKNLFQVDSWWRYLFWHCSYCLCLCDDGNSGSDRYFNLRDVTSDVNENKVVTGVRIVKRNQIIHIQIQQGILTSRGLIQKPSLSWKPVENYTVDDDHVQNGIDYYTMNWADRAIDTDEVFGPSEHVVTGIRFRKIGSHLNLEVRVTPINFTSGELFRVEQSYWLGNDNTEGNLKNPRKEILLRDPDIPLRNGPHSLNSQHDQYIQFQSTSFDKDAAQSTVPFIDSQALTSQGFPISGVGLIHRGKSGSGGFIAPKLISYDFTPHLKFEESN